MKRPYKVLLVIIIAFGCFYALSKIYSGEIYRWFLNFVANQPVAYLLTYLVISIPLLTGLLLIHKPKYLLAALGINEGFTRGILLAFLLTLPMLVGYGFFLEFNSGITINGLLINVLFAALFEEVIYRGVLFGQIFRFAGIGFIPATLLSALVFAAGHLGQSTEISALLGIFMVTFAGAAFFAWTYIEWNNNLWVPIGLHLFMNLHWMLFSAGDTALGGIYANVFRAVTIAATIIFTLFYKKRKKLEVSVNRRTLWVNHRVKQLESTVL